MSAMPFMPGGGAMPPGAGAPGMDAMPPPPPHSKRRHKGGKKKKSHRGGKKGR